MTHPVAVTRTSPRSEAILSRSGRPFPGRRRSAPRAARARASSLASFAGRDFTGVDLNAYDDSLHFAELLQPMDRRVRARRRGAGLAELHGADAGRPRLCRPLALGESRPGATVGVEGAQKHVPGAVLRECTSESALPALRPGWTGHGLVREPEPARDARGRPRDRPAKDKSHPVDRPLEPDQPRPPHAARAPARGICASASRTSAPSRPRVTRIYDFFGLDGDPEAADEGVTTVARPLAAAQEGNRGSAPPHRRARARPLPGISSAGPRTYTDGWSVDEVARRRLIQSFRSTNVRGLLSKAPRQ